MVAFPPRRGTSSSRRSSLGSRRQASAVLSAVALTALALTGCSSEPAPRSAPSAPSAAVTTVPSSSASGSASTATPSPTGSTQPPVNGNVVKQARTLTITIRGQQVSPAPGRITLTRGQTLRLVVTSDRANELHAHGFDVKADLVAGRPTTMDLTGSQPGRYDVETHDPALTLLQVLVR